MIYSLATGAAIIMNMSIEPWYAINDDVMGGLSSGGMTMTGQHLHFHGELSLQNNGGFASVRRLASEDYAHSPGLRLTVKGDGRRYQLRLRQDGNLDGVAWRHEFLTDGSVQVIVLHFPDFEPVIRGRLVKNAGTIDPAHIKQLGFLIADSLEGVFSLSILKIEILRRGTAGAPLAAGKQTR